jgi:integrase
MLCRKCKQEISDTPFCPLCGTKQAKPSHKPKTRGNGTGTAFKRGSTWTAQVTVGKKIIDGKRRLIRPSKGGFATKKEALAYCEQLRAREDGTLPEMRTLDYYWELYQKGKFKKLSANTQSAYRTARKKMDDVFYRDITKLKIEALQDCIDKHASTYDPAKDMQSILSHCFQLAMAEQLVTVNLAKFITLPELDASEGIPFNQDEIDRLWAAYGNGYMTAGYSLLMIYSGMMPGELFKAKKEMIRWDEQQIIGAGLKTKKRRSTPIVIADFMIPILRDLCDFTPSDKLCYTSRDKFYDEFKHMLFLCRCRPELVPYSCRHTTATLSALNNVAQSVLLEIMRQKKFTTTQRYIHIDVTKSLEAINLLKQELMKND